MPRKPRMGRPVSTGRRDGPQTVIRWSAAEHEHIVEQVTDGDPKAVARWLRRLALTATGYKAADS